MLAMMMTLRNNSGTDPSSSNPPAVVYRDVAVAGGAPLLLLLHTLYFSILLNFTQVCSSGAPLAPYFQMRHHLSN